MNFQEWYNHYSQDNDEAWRYSFQSKHAWDACKQEVLKILNRPLQNLDLSEDYCEQRYIDKIKEL